MEKQENTLIIRPQRIIIFFVITGLILLTFSLVGQYLRLFPNSYSISSPIQEDIIRDFTMEFDVNTEANISTYYNVLILAIAAFLLFAVTALKNINKDKYRIEWAALAWVVLYFSMDDASVIHEKFSKYFKDWTDMGGFFEYKWVIVGIPVVLILAILFLRFWLHLETKFKILFLVSAGIYFTGSLGSELISGRWAYSNGTKNFTYALLTTFEEGLELGGVTLLIYSLLHYLEVYFPSILLLSQKTKNSIPAEK